MLTRIRRFFWPGRVRRDPEFIAFQERMQSAIEFGVTQRQASIQNQRRRGPDTPTRDFSGALGVPPVWRKEGK